MADKPQSGIPLDDHDIGMDEDDNAFKKNDNKKKKRTKPQKTDEEALSEKVAYLEYKMSNDENPKQKKKEITSKKSKKAKLTEQKVDDSANTNK